MKTTLAFDQRAGQFKADVGKPSRRFYLGSDAATANDRKLALVKFWERCQASGKSEWDNESLAVANSIRKGESVKLNRRDGEGDGEYLERETKAARLIGKTAPITGAVTERDYLKATESVLLERIAQLESL